jgi:hypothetical protein
VELRLVRVVAWHLPDPQRQGPSTRNTVVSGLGDQTSAQTTGVAGVRAALATAPAADRRDRSV